LWWWSCRDETGPEDGGVHGKIRKKPGLSPDKEDFGSTDNNTMP